MSRIFDALEHDWLQLSHQRHNAFALQDARQVAGNATCLSDLIGHVRSAAPPQADRVLLCLIRHVVTPDPAVNSQPASNPAQPQRPDTHTTPSTQDLLPATRPGRRRGHNNRDLATRTLMQLLLPGTRRLARRWWAVGDDDERAIAATGAVYTRIRTYPLARRPGKIAANVLLDAERELRRAAKHNAPWTTSSPDRTTANQADHHEIHLVEAIDDTALHQHPHNTHPDLELADLLLDAARHGILTPTQAQLIARTRIAGERIPDLATSSGLKPRTLWDHRHNAEQTLIHTASALA